MRRRTTPERCRVLEFHLPRSRSHGGSDPNIRGKRPVVDLPVGAEEVESHPGRVEENAGDAKCDPVELLEVDVAEHAESTEDAQSASDGSDDPLDQVEHLGDEVAE